MVKISVFYLLLLVLLLHSACSLSKKAGRISIDAAQEEVSDSVKYELIVLDPGFDTWMVTHARPLWYHSKSYLESWNRQYVNAWNGRIMSGRSSRYFETYIDYQPGIDYGIELNYKLYNYFQYVERELRIPILPEGMRPGLN